MSVSVVRTRHQGEGVDIAASLDIDAYDTVVACSGDGLPHEIFNGLAGRPDARRALASMPVAHIPCGSGNAMSCNLYGTYRAGPAALAIVKGVETPLDLVRVTQGDRRYVSFLSQSLGIVAESDLATENMRWMGGARFTVGFLARIFGGKVYPCDVAMKVEVEGTEELRGHYRRGREGVLVGAEGKGDGEAEEGSSSGGDGEGMPELRWGTVKDKVPEGWEVVSYDKLGNFYCGNVSISPFLFPLPFHPLTTVPTHPFLFSTPPSLTKATRCPTWPPTQTSSPPPSPPTASPTSSSSAATSPPSPPSPSCSPSRTAACWATRASSTARSPPSA